VQRGGTRLPIVYYAYRRRHTSQPPTRNCDTSAPVGTNARVVRAMRATGPTSSRGRSPVCRKEPQRLSTIGTAGRTPGAWRRQPRGGGNGMPPPWIVHSAALGRSVRTGAGALRIGDPALDIESIHLLQTERHDFFRGCLLGEMMWHGCARDLVRWVVRITMNQHAGARGLPAFHPSPPLLFRRSYISFIE